MNKTKIYHQTGHNTIWNIESFCEDKVGDGLIWSPRDNEYEKTIKLDNKIKCCSFFDPQFYLPSSNRKKLNTYDFFPNKTLKKGYSTELFLENCYMIAEKCVKFQIANNFKYIIIPSLYFDKIKDNNIDKNDILIVKPFMDKIKSLNRKNAPVLLSVMADENLMKDDIYRENLITYITSFQNINGVYLIPICKRTGKRIDDQDFLFYLLQFIYYLKYNDLEIHVGYNDIEGLLLTMANVDSVSIGAYENVRNFNIEKFKEAKKGGQGPRPRLFSSTLLQWIDNGYFGAIKRQLGDLSVIFDYTKYNKKFFAPSYSFHFTKPELYKHFFISFSNLIYSLPTDYEKRYTFIINYIANAKNLYDRLNKTISFDENSDGTHLIRWESALKEYNNFVKL